MSATDPTAGERVTGRLVAHPEPGKVWVQVPHRNDIGGDWIEADELPTPAEPDAGDVEALAKAPLLCSCGHLALLGWHTKHGCQWDDCPCALDVQPAVLASDWLDAVRRKAGDERAEQIAQAIEATEARVGFQIAVEHAARIARSPR